MFIDKYKHLDVVEDYANFLKVMKDLEPYIVKFKEDRTIKAKLYPDDYIVKGQNQ